MSLLFNMLSRFIIAFFLRSKHLFISWLQSPSAVILEPKKIKSVTVSIISPSICHEVMGPDAMILVFESWVLSRLFHSSFTFIKRLFSFSLLSVLRVVSSASLRLLIFLPAILIPACASPSPAFLFSLTGYYKILNIASNQYIFWITVTLNKYNSWEVTVKNLKLSLLLSL